MKSNSIRLYNKKIINSRIKNPKIKKSNENILEKNKENIDCNINSYKSDKDKLISTNIFLDEKQLKIDYEKIEQEFKKLKNNNYNKIERINQFKKNNLNQNSQNFIKNDNYKINEDLFSYSNDDEKENKLNKIKEIVIPIINANNNKDILDFKDNKPNASNIKMKSFDFNEIEYGINENGNPINIKRLNKNEKIIAYIIQPNLNKKEENYLIDLNGEKIPQMKDGDFSYLDNNKKIIIRNFDVQNPKLRIYGANKRMSSLFSEISLDSPIKKIKIRNNIKTFINNNNFTKEGTTKNNIRQLLFYSNSENNRDMPYQNKKQNDRTFNLFFKPTNEKDIINHTIKILYKNEDNDLFIKNGNKIGKYQNNLSLRNIYLDNLSKGNNTSREYKNIRTQFNINKISFSNKNISYNTSKTNLIQKKNNRYKAFYNNNIYNNIINDNMNKSVPNSSKFDYKKKPLFSNSETNIFPNSFFYSLNNKINERNNPLIKKNKRPRIYINTTIKGIQNNIKNNIKDTLKKIFKNNQKLNKSHKQFEDNISFKIYNSNNNPNKVSFIELPKNNEKKKLNFNNEIRLNKKYKISTSPERNLVSDRSKCSVLSKQADKMIKDYFAKIPFTQRDNKSNKKMNNGELLKNGEQKSDKIISTRSFKSLSNSSNNKIKKNIRINRIKNTINVNKNSLLRILLERKKIFLKSK